VFDDEAETPIASGSPPFTGTFQPDQPLSAADGISGLGDWSLKVIDGAGSDVGTIDEWVLTLTFPGEACGPHASYETHWLEQDSCPTGGAGDADGYWDPGETGSLALTMRNDGTGTLTNVSARVTPLVPGVSMIDDVLPLGDVAPGATATTGGPHFLALLDEGVECGSTLSFDVEFTTDEGTWNEPFVQAVGNVLPGGGVALFEGFDSGIPLDWTIVDGLEDGLTWFADDASDPSGCGNPDPGPPIAGGWAAVDSDCAGSVPMDEQLISPVIDLSAAWTVSLEFDHLFDRYAAELGDVDVRSSLTSGNWVNVARFDADMTATTHEVLDLTAWAAGQADVELRFRYYNAEFEWFWYVDNVQIGFTAAGSCEMAVCRGGTGSGPAPVPWLLADRMDAEGSQLMVSWDDQCSPTSAKIVYGPLEAVSTMTVTDGRCAISNPEVWDAVPEGSLWFLVVGDNGTGIESSWGESTVGERNGASASGTCGSEVKDTTTTCP
jgi:hypothetical protein